MHGTSPKNLVRQAIAIRRWMVRNRSRAAGAYAPVSTGGQEVDSKMEDR